MGISITRWWRDECEWIFAPFLAICDFWKTVDSIFHVLYGEDAKTLWNAWHMDLFVYYLAPFDDGLLVVLWLLSPKLAVGLSWLWNLKYTALSSN